MINKKIFKHKFINAESVELIKSFEQRKNLHEIETTSKNTKRIVTVFKNFIPIM